MEKGAIVRSTAGHDKGRLYVVLSAEGKNLFLADGRRRTMDKPKKKQIKHVEFTGAETDVSKLKLNAHVRKVIKNYISEGGCCLG